MVSCSVFLPPPMVWVPLGGGLERCTIYSSCDSGSQEGTWVTCRAWSFKYMGMHPFKFGSLRWRGTYLGYVKFKVPHSTTPRWRDWNRIWTRYRSLEFWPFGCCPCLHNCPKGGEETMPSNVSRMQHAMTHTHGSGTFQMFQVSRAAHHGPGMSRLQLVLVTSHSENKPFI